jgi:thioredoxin-like negative regulator of GroEL
MKPLVEGLEKEYAGKVEFRRLNVEKDQAGVDLANSLNIQYVPTFVFVNANGIISQQTVGAMTEQQFRAALDALQ